MTDVGHARRVLFRMGEELPGERLTAFVADLLAARAASPDDDPPTLIERAMVRITDGPLALVAEEPSFATMQLTDFVRTAGDAARAALTVFARDLLDRDKRGDFDRLWTLPAR